MKHGDIQEKVGRAKLTAFISDDDGRSWQGGLMLDERDDVTYPDGVQAKDGVIYLIYDHQRTPLGEVLLTSFRKEDVRAGKSITGKELLRVKIADLPQP